MNKIVDINIKGIKCDNKECDYKKEDVAVEDYKDWVNKPCPNCGHNLLTETDYFNVKCLLSLINSINDNLKCSDAIDENSVQSTMNVIGRLNMDGTGKIHFEEIK